MRDPDAIDDYLGKLTANAKGNLGNSEVHQASMQEQSHRLGKVNSRVKNVDRRLTDISPKIDMLQASIQGSPD